MRLPAMAVLYRDRAAPPGPAAGAPVPGAGMNAPFNRLALIWHDFR